MGRAMPKTLLAFIQLALFLHLISVMSCLEYQEARVTDSAGANLPPYIDKVHVSPSPSELLKPLNIGLNCRAKDFIIPPIKDPNRGDQLYYLWFFKRQNDLYGKLLQPGPGIIRSEDRDAALVSLQLDRQTIERALGEKLGDAFFDSTYIIEFYVADRKYLIPENRFNDADAREDYMHWTIKFVDNKC
jgi:hypothetical protein